MVIPPKIRNVYYVVMLTRQRNCVKLKISIDTIFVSIEIFRSSNSFNKKTAVLIHHQDG